GFCFVYLLISTMHGVSEPDAERGLTSAAIGALEHARSQYRDYFDRDWRSGNAVAEFGALLRQAVTHSQSACALVCRDLTILRKACLDGADSFLRESHALFKSRLKEFEHRAAGDHV